MTSFKPNRRTLFARALVLATTFSASVALAQEPPPEETKPPEEQPPVQQPVAPSKLPLRKGSQLPGRGLVPGKIPAVMPEKKFNFPAADPARGGQGQVKNPAEDEGTTTVTPDGTSNGPPGLTDLKVVKGQKCKPLPQTQKVMFDFKGDILELVATISKTTCRNFILTNKVRSQKFEIISPTPITVAEAWAAFLSSLEANEFGLVQVGKYYKIIQATDATRSPVPFYEDGEEIPITDAMITKIYKLKHATDLNGVVNYLNIFKSGKGQVHPYLPTGTLIATDFATNLYRIERILKEIDQPGALEQLHVVPVEFANAQEIAEKLTQVFEPQKAAAGTGKGPASSSRIKVRPNEGVPPQGGEGFPGGPESTEEEPVSVSKILADERTNKLIIIASERSFKQIMSLKKELDVPDTGSDSQIQVVRLKHADADELASTLASLAQGRPTTARPGRTSVGGAGNQKQAVPAQPAGNQNAAGASASLFQGEVKITADKPTNSLLVTASKGDFISLRRVIDRLDIARYQVFVEAVILEVSVKRDRQLGFTWHGGVPVSINGNQSPIIFGNQPTSQFSSIQASLNPLSLASVLGFAGVVRGPTLEGSESLITGGIPSIGVVIQALQTSNNVNVVSTPHLLTLDNEEAEIQVNEKRPFPSGLSLGGLSGLGGLGGAAGGAAGGLGNLAGLGLGSLSFNREDVGLTLKLKPQISDEDYVRLELDQELSDVAGVDAATNQTVTSKRAAKTVVVVRNQDSVVIGGLVRDRESIDESKVPLFGDLPLIGWLFKRQVKVAEKVNLLLVLTPYIIRGPQDFQSIFERKMQERKEFVDRYHGEAFSYEAEIDWTRKRGPVANYRMGIRRELNKAENEGPGEEGQTIIKPDEVKNGGATIGPVDTAPAGGHEGTPIIEDQPPVTPNDQQHLIPDTPDDM